VLAAVVVVALLLLGTAIICTSLGVAKGDVVAVRDTISLFVVLAAVLFKKMSGVEVGAPLVAWVLVASESKAEDTFANCSFT
jgi:hypothetical protein